MPCFHPRTAWRSLSVNASGKRSLVFDPRKALPGSELKIACQQCSGCRVDRSQQWATRMMHERLFHDCCSFLTITYADHFLPENGQLVPLDVKKLVKALNDKFGPELREKYGQGVRYVLCGEYGDQNGRPHYHIILFGVDFHEDRKPFKKTEGGEQLYTSETLNRLWGKGYCFIGSVTEESCGYVARYILKKVNGDLAADHYARVNEATGEWYMLLPEFVRMSNRPGIGRRFFDDPVNRNMYARGGFPRGRTNKLKKIPGYYDRQLERVDPEGLKVIKAERVRQAELRKADNTTERLAVKEEILKAKIERLKREM
jgi:hypothetical protein